KHCPWRIGCELSLKINQCAPHPRDCRDHGCGIPHLLRFQYGIAKLFGIELKRGSHRERLVRQIGARIEQRLCDSAIDHAGIEVTISVMMGEALAERALAGGGRPIDGNNHENSAPSARIIGMKSGNEVAMNAVSSTFTGLSAANPITSADIAMR